VSETPTVETAARLRLTATRLARRLRQEAETGLSPSQLSALSVVEKHGPITVGALAGHERVAAPTATRVVQKLEESGLVAKAVDPGDRRVTHLTITRQGRTLLAESRQRKTAWLAAQLDALAPAQRTRLAAALDVLDCLLDEADR
jgi:DNA-binding MarR family transcriptional regulator